MASNRKARSAKERHNIITAYDKLPKTSQRDAVDLLRLQGFEINQSCLCKVLKERHALIDRRPETMRNRKGKFEELEVALDRWIFEGRSKGAPLSGPIIKAKAEEFASMFGVENFKCSEGWFSNFKKRHQLKFVKLHGEAASADVTKMNEWLTNRWPVLRQNYEDHEIWNADETGLLFRALPQRTFLHREEKLKSGTKKSKEHLTVLFCVSFTGQKRMPFVIGKSKKPRCFNGLSALPVRYRANKSAWMNASLFGEWLKEWNEELRRKGEKALLLVDNCMAHSLHEDLEHLQVVFLPPNTTSILQPLDQGIIRAFKAHFRRSMVLNLLQEIDDQENNDSTSLAKKLSVLDGIVNLKFAWDAVTIDTIMNCWKKFTSPVNLDDGNSEEDPALLPPEGMILKDWNDFIEVDAHVYSTEVTNESIVSGISRRNDEGEDSSQEDDDEVTVVPSRRDMLAMVERLKLGLVARGGDECISILRKIENETLRLTKDELKQRKIADFFCENR